MFFCVARGNRAIVAEIHEREGTMTMVRNFQMRTMAAGKFKAQCLALLDEVEAKRESVVVTKNGRPVARMMPMPLLDEDPIFGFYRGKLDILGDVMSPVHSDEEYKEFFERSAAQLL